MKELIVDTLSVNKLSRNQSTVTYDSELSESLETNKLREKIYSFGGGNYFDFITSCVGVKVKATTSNSEVEGKILVVEYHKFPNSGIIILSLTVNIFIGEVISTSLYI